MEIRRPEHPLVYMKSVKPRGRKHGRKRSRRAPEAAPQLTVNVLLLPPRAVILLYFFYCFFAILGREGFEPSKAVPTDLQSAPFGHSGICP